MKRSAMPPRTTRMNRMSEKRARNRQLPQTQEARDKFVLWRLTQQHCYFCHWYRGTPFPHSGWLPKLEANHVFGKHLRELTLFDLWAMTILCAWCHQEVWPRTRDRARVVFGMALKLENDPLHLNIDAANELRARGELITRSEVESFVEHELVEMRARYLERE